MSERKITHGPDQAPLYGCCQCYDERSLPASDLRIYQGECWCELCWEETDMAAGSDWSEGVENQPKPIDFPSLAPFVPATDAELERLREALGRLVEAADALADICNASAADNAINAARAALNGEGEM